MAAIQMASHVGDMDANIQDAENWIEFALRRGARWIVLPEFFVSGMSYQPEKMLDAVQPLDGDATRMLKRQAKESGSHIGGTYLVESDGDVFNTFVLAAPDGRIFSHDKDFPSGFVEHSFYAGGEDEEFVEELDKHGIPTQPIEIPGRSANIKSGVFAVDDATAVGVAICWEQVRYRTARRLRANVDFILSASAWGFLDYDVGVAEVAREDLERWADKTKRMVSATPGRLARLVGAPVVHANIVGSGWSRDGRPGKPLMLGRGMGDSQIVDAEGTVLGRRPSSEGEGVVVAEVQLGRTAPVDPIPSDEFWMPGFTDVFKESWYWGGGAGRDYYLNTARPRRLDQPRG